MMYMPDAIRATMELMEAPANTISVRWSSYNLAAMTFAPEEVAASIQKEIPCQISPYPMHLISGRR